MIFLIYYYLKNKQVCDDINRDVQCTWLTWWCWWSGTGALSFDEQNLEATMLGMSLSHRGTLLAN